jgi:SAM-dependent methyltransferase
MRQDWDARAREDAHYYVAFGRREQTEEEFLSTAAEVVASIEWELKRLPPANPRSRRALEIGCGPGRLMKPLARDFGEIHGVDVSEEMARLARRRLSDIPHAHVHVSSGSSLEQFADESFDMTYSYAVFQHIPDKHVVFGYLREVRRVLKTSGLLRAQFNGLPETNSQYDTWAGVRFTPGELIEFARRHDFQILALEGAGTQYLWTTWRKRTPGWRDPLERSAAQEPPARIRRITNAHDSNPIAPASGRFAAISVWVEHFPDDCNLFDLEVLVNGSPAQATYIGPRDSKGLQQINAILPALGATGLIPVELRWFSRPLGDPGILRVIPAGPDVPRLVAVTDGVNLLAGTRIETRRVKVAVESVAHPQEFSATVNGEPVAELESFCTDPLARRYEFNFKLPDGLGPGTARLELRLGRRQFEPIPIEVAR